METQKFSESEDKVFLFMWHVTLLRAFQKPSLQVSTNTSRYFISASLLNLMTNGSITFSLLVTTPNMMIGTGCLVFICLEHISGSEKVGVCSVSSPFDPGRIFFFSSEKNRGIFFGGDAYVCPNAMQPCHSSSRSWPEVFKKRPFSSCERNTEYLHALFAW